MTDAASSFFSVPPASREEIRIAIKAIEDARAAGDKKTHRLSVTRIKAIVPRRTEHVNRVLTLYKQGLTPPLDEPWGDVRVAEARADGDPHDGEGIRERVARIVESATTPGDLVEATRLASTGLLRGKLTTAEVNALQQLTRECRQAMKDQHSRDPVEVDDRATYAATTDAAQLARVFDCISSDELRNDVLSYAADMLTRDIAENPIADTGGQQA